MIELIRNYYKVRKLKWPTVGQAMMWVETELGEVYEVLLARDGGWIRNNPDKQLNLFNSDALAEELGDAIMMLIVAGIVEGVDPLAALREKIERKIREAA